MKIAIYVPSWPPGFVANGIVTYASNLVPALRRLGHEVFVLTDATRDSDAYTIELRRYAEKPNLLDKVLFRLAPESKRFKATSVAMTRAIRELVAKHMIDVLEIEESFGWAFAVSRLNLVPVVVRLHGPWFLMGKFDNQHNMDRANQHRQRFEGRAIESAHYVTANCLETLNSVKRHYGLALTRSCVMPNPIDAVPEAEAWNIERCDHEKILFVGRFDKVKGGDLVLNAFAMLADAFPRLRLTFVGPDRGIETEPGKRQSFHQYMEAHLPGHVRSRVDFRGALSHSEVMSLRSQHFITIIAAQYDTMGYMMMEAMSLGCPIITTAVGGIPEYIHDHQNGLLVPSQDARAMAAACKELLENRDLASKLGRQAWLDCRAHCNPETVAKQTISAYQDAIALTRTAPPR
jgi:glycosyltransferase involved in cell wall biosynthesis